MTLLEMQILFQQIIEDTSPGFFDKERVDTYDILNYLNQAAMRSMDKYISLPTTEQNIRLISENTNDLKDMIRKVRANTFYTIGFTQVSMEDGIAPYTMPGGAAHHGPYGDNSVVYHMPHDYLHIISCHIKSSRTGADVLPSSSPQWHKCEIVTHDQAERFITTSFNKPIMREPVIILDADGFFTVIYDSEQLTPLNDIEFVYLRKPHKLDFDFQWLDGGTGIVLTSSMVNKSVRVKKGSVVEYPSNNLPLGGYRAGSKFNVLNGYYLLLGLDSNTPMYVGYPGDSTDELSIASYLHENIVRMAVSMLLDEAKLRLVQKQTA
jgi:hypothetical protein